MEAFRGVGTVEITDANGLNKLYLEASGDGPSIRINDQEGYAASLGADDLVTEKTGEKSKRSAASLVLFAKDKNVLWSAP